MAGFSPTIHEADLPDGRFCWLEAGPPDAPVALSLHGFPDHPRTFEPLVDRLVEAGFRVVAPWMRGYAPSVKQGPYDAGQLGEDVVALADAVSPGRPVLLIGHDWGAIAAWHAAGRAPERFSTLVALSVPHPAAFARNLWSDPRQLLRSWYVGAVQVPFLPERVLAARNFAVLRRGMSTAQGGLPHYWPDLVATMRASLPAPIEYYRALRRKRPEAGRIHVPTLFLTGAKDPAVGAEMGAGQSRWVDAPFDSAVLDAGHWLHHELPGEVADRILGFVRRA